MAVFVFVLYRLFSASAPTLSLVAAVLGIGGSVILAAMWLIAGDRNAAPQNIATWADFFALRPCSSASWPIGSRRLACHAPWASSASWAAWPG